MYRQTESKAKHAGYPTPDQTSVLAEVAVSPSEGEASSSAAEAVPTVSSPMIRALHIAASSELDSRIIK